MKSPIVQCLFFLFLTGNIYSQNTYSFQKNIDQSPVHDAIQLYYALNNFYFYPQQTAPNTYEVIDSRMSKPTGIIGRFSDVPSESALQLQQDLENYAQKQGAQFQDNAQRMIVNQEVFFDILRRIAQLPSNAGFEDLQFAYQDNPFLSKYFSTSGASMFTDQAALKSVQGFFANDELVAFAENGQSSFLNFSLSALTQGVAEFLIERANEEINAAVFQRLKDQMEAFEEFPVLFPDSKATLDEIESYNYNIAINALKTKFTRDLQQLPYRAGDLVTIQKYQEIFDAYGGFALLFSGLDLLKGLQAGVDPNTLIQEVYCSPYVQSLGISNEVSHILRLSGFLSFALGNKTNDGQADNDLGWFDWNSLENLPSLDKEIFLELYFGILYQVVPDIQFTEAEAVIFDFKAILAEKLNDLEELEQLLLSTVDRFDAIRSELEVVLEKIRTALELGQDGLDVSQFQHYINIAEEVLGIGVDALIEFPDNQDLTGFLARLEQIQLEYIPMLEEISALVQSVALEEFNAVIFDFGILFKRVLQDYYFQLPEIRTLVGQIEVLQAQIDQFGQTAEDIARWKEEMEALQEQLEDQLKDIKGSSVFNEFIYCFLEYGNLIASIALAENGTQVKAAVRATALPVGGSSVKKHSGFNIAVNSYLGYYYRPFEDTTSVVLNDLVSGFTRRHGVYAPIGISLSTGFGKAGSLSAYAGLLDLGAIVSYRLEGDEAVPEVRLVNIFSPSAQVTYGFPFDLPFSLGAGWQWTPANLDAGESFTFDSAFNLFLGVDIPLYHIYNEKKVSVVGLFE